MQKIENIEIKNFKSIRDAKISDCRRVNIFIGYPNVGKSNILEALSLGSNFHNSNISISLKELCRFEDLIGLFNDGDKQKNIEIKINDFIYALSFADNSAVNYYAIHTSDFVKDIIYELVEFQKKSMIHSDGKFSVPLVNEKKERSLIDIKKYTYKSGHHLDKNNPLKLNFPFGGNLFEVIRYNGELRKECGELFKVYNLKLAFDINVNLKIQKQLDEFSVFELPLIQVADTLQRLIFHKAAIATNQKAVLLFEEPEAHMFPTYISKFTSEVMYDKNDNQYFIATHSPYVINDFMENLQKDDYAIYTVGYNNETGETLIRRMTDEELHEVYQYGVDLFLNLENFLPHAQQQ